MHRLQAHSTIQKWTTRCLNLDNHQLRVLIVDDTVDAANALAAYLMIDNIGCRVAYGGREAITAAVDWAPHVILMDISMPECNGFEASMVLRHDARTAHIAIVAYTALDAADVRPHLTDAEFDGYCQKGQSPEKLVALIETFIL